MLLASETIDRMSSGSAQLSHALAVKLVTASSGGAGALVEHSPLGFVIAFGAGIASFVSPCVLPLVPSYLSMMSGVGGVGAKTGAGPDAAERARLLWSTLLFVAGFSLVFAVLEATASTLSHPLQAHKLVLSDVAGALIVAMGVLIAFQLPWLQREHRFAVLPSRLGLGRPGHGHDLCLRLDTLHHAGPGCGPGVGVQRWHAGPR